MSFKKLKSASKKNLDKLTQELEKINSPSFDNAKNGDDDKFWKLTVDKAGNGHAVIRFLPAPNNEDIPWVRRWDHGFQGPGGWYIENSLTSIGKKDPVSEYNSLKWNNGTEADKDVIRKDRKRRLRYYSNVVVVDDPANPANNGQVFLFQYGKKIFDKITEAMSPEFEGDEAVNPFDLWAGANFKLRARKVSGFRNYDASGFANPSPLSEDESEMEESWNKCYSLQEFLDPKEFKSYDELKARMTKVLALDDGSTYDTEDSPSNGFFAGSDDGEGTTNPPRQSFQEAPSLPEAGATTEEEDESLSYFSKLAEEV